MPLQNRVDPFGELFADRSRGLFMGNRGGRIHNDERTLSSRRWVSRQWICCRLAFNGRHRSVWGHGYTELFFLDEVTALAAGHRPCFECRRKDAQAFADAWARASRQGLRPRAAEVDDHLHAERLDRRAKRLHRRKMRDLPDGVVIVRDGEPHALHQGTLLRWTPSGYGARLAQPGAGAADVLTPPSILGVLAAGYAPQWHPSAECLEIAGAFRRGL